MGKFKSFTPEKKNDEKVEREPIGFELYGEDFECAPSDFQSYKLIEFSHNTTSKDNAKVTGAIIDFFKYVLTEDDHERLLEILNSPDKIVEMEDLMGIVDHIISEYTSRDPKE